MATPPNPPGVQNRHGSGSQVQKHFRMSSDDWTKVARRMLRVGETNFSKFARQQLKNGYVVSRPSDDFSGVIDQLARIGNNINQIAKKANTDNVATFEQVVRTQYAFDEALQILDDLHIVRRGHNGGSEGSQHI